jgi:hypothetical protein
MQHYCIKYCLTFLTLILGSIGLDAQAVYEPVDNNPVYELLDELASLKVITINSAVKPYSRVFIANKLEQAIQNAEKLNKRQLAEVKFYLKDYSFELNSEMAKWRNGEKISSPSSRDHVFSSDPIAISYCGNVFKLRATPWLGGRFMVNENGNFKEFSGGGEVFGYLGKHIGYYANVKYIWESEPLVNPVIFSLEEGKSWNYMGNGSVENTELRGGISVGWNWGEFGIFKDRPVWGNAIHGTNIMSGHPPSFPYIQLHLKPATWIEFYSITGALKSDVIDSSRSSFEPGPEHIVYHRKYMSANFFTITPWKRIDISFGNSIFWSDVFKVGYLMPFNLYKSVDETLKGSLSYADGLNTNDDGHLFFDISSRNIKHLQLYLSLWIDEWKTARIFKKNQHNDLSWKVGVSLYDLPVKNLSLTIEGLSTRPGTYEEYNPANLYANEDYSFGNYLRGDAWELYVCTNYKPIRGLQISASYDIAQRGGYVYLKDDEITYPLSKNLTYNQTTLEINASYRLLTNVKALIGYKYTQNAGDLKYIPQIFQGKTSTLSFGINVGF